MSNFKLVKNFMSSTVFVPWDCSYNCQFCNSKESYRIIPNNMEKVLESIKFVTASEYIDELLITGGEPLSNLENLKRIIEASNKKVYINTSFTKEISKNNTLIDYLNSEEKIFGLSISRHFFKRLNEAEDCELSKIRKPIKLNCYIGKSSDYSIEELLNKFKNYIDRFAFLKDPTRIVKIQFREDYRFTKHKNLRGLTTNSVKALYGDSRFCFIFSGGCLACAEDAFKDTVTGHLIYYHRGLNNTAIKVHKNSPIVCNDVIIYQNGEICYDWRTESQVLNPSRSEKKLRQQFKEFLFNEEDKNYILSKWSNNFSQDLRFIKT